MKKLFSVFLCLTMWLSAFGQDFYVDGIYYNIIGNNQVEVTYDDTYPHYRYYGNVTIPSSVIYDTETYSVTSIGSSAFYECFGLTSVTIPNSVTSIGSCAFYNCYGLTSVTIPNSVTSIGSGAFYNCYDLTSVTIPNSVTSIGSSAFYYCTGLTSVTIPNSVTSIGSNPFDYCSGLTSIIVESGNTYYDSRNNCNAIIETSTNSLIAGCMNTVIPNGVTTICSYAFRGCSGLTSVTIPNSVTSIGSYAFYGCSGLSSVTIPDGVTTIYESAFADCNKLVTLSIPSSVISIGNEVFYGCDNLAVINCYATIPPAIREGTFEKYDATLYVPANSVGLYQSRDYWKNFFIMPIQEDGLEYSLADRNVDYLNGRIYNENGLEIRLYDASGRLVTSGDGDIDMSNCPNGIYLVTDGKGGSLKIVHRR
ncbi:MAG: leucine-rich repeat domain-containing protein [Paludibacteraceae bacterium]|nr:leucine-rich repeat domain-containing protein [Paludibacteraceae bacterium]